MKLEQTWKPKNSYCIMCGTTTINDTCSATCSNKLTKIHDAIDNRIEMEKAGAKDWNNEMIIEFNKIQEIIG